MVIAHVILGCYTFNTKVLLYGLCFARNRGRLVSIVPRWYELYLSDFLFPEAVILRRRLGGGLRSTADSKITR